MRNVAFWFHHHVADTLAVLFIAVTLTLLLKPVVHASLDRNQRCVYNAYTLTAAVAAYSQDYDGRLPRVAAFNTFATFQNDILPYTRDNTVFRCPALGNVPYTLNQSVAGIAMSTLPEVSVVELFRDPRAHPDGKSTVAYLDGHVERGGVEQRIPAGPVPTQLCFTRQIGISAAISMYAQDYDETYPFHQDDDALRSALVPYTNNRNLFDCPDSFLPYILGTEFRGRTIPSILDRSSFVVVDDPVSHRSTDIQWTSYLDGYREQNGPNGIVFPNAPFESARRLRAIVRGLTAYIQDNQGNLPLYSNYAEFETALMPYVRASRAFLPPRGGMPFQVNLSLSGTKLSDYPNPFNVIVIRDLNNYGDSQITVGRLNGQASRSFP